jgi:hypothetical protein
MSLCAALGCAAGVTLVAVAGQPEASSANAGRDAQQYTQLISRSTSGGVPNGPSGHPAISGDKRYAGVVAFDSQASNIVSGDSNGEKDVFVVRRAGNLNNQGTKWHRGRTLLVSRSSNGNLGNGPSFSPSLDGGFARRTGNGKAASEGDYVKPSCVAFLSAATNLVSGDGNGHVDAFVSKLSNGHVERATPDGSNADASAVTVSGDCQKVASVAGGKLYVYDVSSGKTDAIDTAGQAGDPSFAVGRTDDLVFSTPRGVYLLEEGGSSPRLIAPGGRNPSYTNLNRKVVAYEKKSGGNWQIAFRQLGRGQKIASRLGGSLGNGDSRDPQIGNDGYAIAFETDATNLGVNALGRPGDNNGAPDVYLYTDVRKITLLQSTQDKAVPMLGGGQDPAMSYYYNYILFAAASPLGQQVPSCGRRDPAPCEGLPTDLGARQVYMRYLGSV